MARKLLFVTDDIPESEGIQVQLRSLDPKVITPRDKFIPTLDGKDLKIRKRFSMNTLQVIFDKALEGFRKLAESLKVPMPSTETLGQAITEAEVYSDEITGSDWNLTEERFCTQEGEDVTERKHDIVWMKETPSGERSEASLTPSDRISIIKRVPLDMVQKGLIQENRYLVYAWHGDRKTPVKYYQNSVSKLRELADDMALKHEGGLCSFTWGN